MFNLTERSTVILIIKKYMKIFSCELGQTIWWNFLGDREFFDHQLHCIQTI